MDMENLMWIWVVRERINPPPKLLIGGANILLTSSTLATSVLRQLAIGVAAAAIGPPRRTMLAIRTVCTWIVQASIQV